MGVKKDEDKAEFDTSVVLRVEEGCGIQSEALEAGRIAITSHMNKVLDPQEDYFIKGHTVSTPRSEIPPTCWYCTGRPVLRRYA